VAVTVNGAGTDTSVASGSTSISNTGFTIGAGSQFALIAVASIAPGNIWDKLGYTVGRNVGNGEFRCARRNWRAMSPTMPITTRYCCRKTMHSAASTGRRWGWQASVGHSPSSPSGSRSSVCRRPTAHSAFMAHCTRQE
jgi:hypothetical protein